LIFLNLITVVIIRQTLVNLDRSFAKEVTLFTKLQKEIEAVDQLNIKLAESEAHYKTLFFLSPLPKWIYDIGSMKIRQVNDAALNEYGYSQDELLTMSMIDVQDEMHQKSAVSISTELVKQNGDVRSVDVKWVSILYQGKPSRLFTVADNTERVNHLNEIKHQNQKLQEIAFMQAHVIRSPLAKIMALSDLIMIEYDQLQTEPLFVYLNKSTVQLDEVVREIIKNSEEILGETENGYPHH
jgi:PAS domain S-box-containing protein